MNKVKINFEFDWDGNSMFPSSSLDDYTLFRDSLFSLLSDLLIYKKKEKNKAISYYSSYSGYREKLKSILLSYDNDIELISKLQNSIKLEIENSHGETFNLENFLDKEVHG